MNPQAERNRKGAIENLDDLHWDRVIIVSLCGVYLAIKLSARLMKPHGGRIIGISLIEAIIDDVIVGIPYIPAMARVDHLAHLTAMDLGVYNMHVYNSPGLIITTIADARPIKPSWSQSL